MENKNNKLKSLKSILILLQQLQVRYYGKCSIDLVTYSTENIDILIYSDGHPSRSFGFTLSYPKAWADTYDKIVTHLSSLKL